MSDEQHTSLFEPTPADDEQRRPAARERPADPAGTKPRHDPASLLPESPEPLLRPRDEEPPGEVDENAAEDSAPVAVPASPAPHAARFQFFYGILIGIA